MSSKPELVVDWCSYKAAKYAVEHWHYSQSMPAPPRMLIGVWENNYIGCVIFSRGSNNNGHKPYKIKMTEFCELTRVALNRHKWPVSSILSRSIHMLKNKSPMIRLIVSYADPNESHHGGVYQAGNWIYTGQTAKDFKAVDPNGREWHSRQVSKTGVKRQFGEYRTVPRFDQCEIIPLLGKHRYLYPLDRAMRRQIEPLAQPYPKKLDVRPVNGDNLATSQAGRFDPDLDAFNQS